MEELRSTGVSADENSEEYFIPSTSLTPVEAAMNLGPDKILDYLDNREPLTHHRICPSVLLFYLKEQYSRS